MIHGDSDAPQRQISLLDYLQQRGWTIVRDSGREEVAGLCPLHRESRPSFYVNRRKQVFYCHGCGRGGGLARLIRLLDGLPQAAGDLPATEQLLEPTYRFYQRQLARSDDARAYLAGRGIHDRAVIEAMRIGYAPGACLRGYLTRLGYGRQALLERGLVDELGRDSFFRCLTFPLVEAGNLYGRSLGNGICRHRFLPGSKGGLYGWPQALRFSPRHGGRRHVRCGGFMAGRFSRCRDRTGIASQQLCSSPSLCRPDARVTYICFDADRNGSGQRAARRLSIQLRHAGVEALRVELPEGHDPASFLAAGASAGDFQRCLERARP